MGATVTVTTNKIELSAQRWNYKGVDLGATIGGTTVTIKTEKAEVKADQKGTTVVDRRVTGIMVTIEGELEQTRAVDTWKTIFPNGVKLTAAGSKEAIELGAPLGSADVDLAGLLTLHPVVAADADISKDISVYKATPSEESAIVYGPDATAKLKLVMNVYEDTTSTPPRWMRFGDSSI